MRTKLLKKRFANLLGAVLVTAILSGCQYSSLDEYLELLGMKDPEISETAKESSFADSSELAEGQDMFPATASDNISDTSSTADSFSEKEPETQLHISATDATSDASFDGNSNNSSITEPVPYDNKVDGNFSSSYKQLTEDELNEEMQTARTNAGITESSIDNLKKQQEGLFAYDRLTGQGKTLYAEILSILQTMTENVPVSTTSADALDLVFTYVMIDHPEIFYVDGYKYTNYTVDDVVTKVSFSGNYTCSEEEAGRRQQEINQAVQNCLAGAPSSEDDYYAIKYVYDYLIQNTDYDASAADNQNIYSVFVNRKSVCNGYAKAAQLLLNKLGVKCTLVTGTVDTKNAKNVRHAWNLVQCNDAYYHMDATWGDSSYQTDNGESADATRLPLVNYDYLNVTTEEILKNHSISDDIYVPNCSSMRDNYYVREDEYFTSTELLLVQDLFNRRYSEGSNNVTMKCASKDIYDFFFENLISQRNVFNYLQGDNSSVSYTSFADTNTIIFWLQ